MSDDITRLSEELARDPGSLVFLQLGELLRARGDMDTALRVALRGLERHSHVADAHDLLARIHVEMGEFDRAFDEWDMAARIHPGHAGAQKGMGFVRYQQGRLMEAERYLAAAVEADPADESSISALAYVRELNDPAAPAGITRPDPRSLFADVLEGAGNAALLLDTDGLVLAGGFQGPSGEDVGEVIGAQLSGVSDEARRAMRHLGVGSWQTIVVETESATVAMAPAQDDGLLVVTAQRSVPLGLVQRMLDRAAIRARDWLAEEAAR